MAQLFNELIAFGKMNFQKRESIINFVFKFNIWNLLYLTSNLLQVFLRKTYIDEIPFDIFLER